MLSFQKKNVGQHGMTNFNAAIFIRIFYFFDMQADLGHEYSQFYYADTDV